MKEFEKLNIEFDRLLVQTQRFKLTHEQIDAGRWVEMFEQVKEWKGYYGFRFNIYGNEHLIDGKEHFHFDNKAENIHCKIDFEGNILIYASKKEVPANILKDLKYFLDDDIKKVLKTMWDRLNPHLRNAN